MAAPVDPTLFKDALIVLGAAAIVVPVFHSLKLSPVLGFILIGMVVGPFGLGAFTADFPWLSYLTIEDKDDMALVAEFGVVLLLFMIGLELSLERLRIMRRLVFGLGTAQVIVSATAIGATTYAISGNATTSTVVGLALAMSSTAIVTQVLSARKEMGTPTGRASFAVLVFQDIAVVPILFAVSVLGTSTEGSLFAKLAVAVAQAAIAVAIVILAGRIALRPLFRRVAQTHSPELFMAACLLVIIATSLAMASAGLSMAMGALIAGLLLAETEYRRQIEVMVEPFKGLLVGVFLISIGMNVDLPRIVQEPLAVLVASAGLVALKTLIVAGIAKALGLTLATGIRSGLVLGPGSEFSFVIIALATGLNLIVPSTAAFALIVVALTMASIPLLHTLGRYLETHLTPAAVPNPAAQVRVPDDETPRVIVAGFGRVGRVIASLLDAHKLPYIAVDSDAHTVAAGRDEGKPVYFGNIKHPDFLRHCGIETATALVVTMDAPKSTSEVVKLARTLRQDLKIIVRARDANHASELYRLGATDAVPETVEASLQLGEAVLVDVGIAMGPAIATIHEKRAEIRSQIQSAAPAADVSLPARRRLRERTPPQQG
ncbi:MAG: cation:proton antiporter [Alphaproteobacteria bacterium]|nr:cation:proton antiporter [Alphaproteobacteria bacterium]